MSTATGPRGRGGRGRRGRGRGAGRGAPRGDDNNNNDADTTNTIDTTTDTTNTDDTTTTDVASNGHATKTTANRGGRRQPASKKIEADDEENDKPKNNKSDNQSKKRSLKDMESEDLPVESKEDTIAEPPAKRTKYNDRRPSNRITIMNLPHDVTEEDVAELVQEKTEVTPKEIRLLRDTGSEPKTTRAFVTFEDTSKVNDVVSKLKPLSYKGTKLDVWFASAYNPNARSDLSGVVSSVGINWLADKVKLKDILAAIPERCRRADDSKITPTRSKGICNRTLKSLARIDFDNPEDAKLVQEQLNETEINIPGIKGNVVTVTFWSSEQPK